KVSLGVKQLWDDPWPTIFNELPTGKQVEATVISTVDYGAFVRVREGIEGLIATGDLIVPEGGELKVGDKVQAEIANIDSQDRRITLSMRIGEGASQPTKAEKRPSMMPKKAAADADKAGGTIGELIKQKLGDKLKEAVAKDEDKDDEKKDDE
ncbi:MAG TPA: S1 RNA-binding domain-containing protein, partial [Polyangiaceae bacterium]